MTTTLNIDDDPIALFLANNAIRSAGFQGEIMEFENGQDVINYLDKITADQVLLLLDINMPNISGWDICEYIIEKKLDEKVQIVIITSSISKLDKIKAANYPFITGYITKPIHMEDVKPFIAS